MNCILPVKKACCLAFPAAKLPTTSGYYKGSHTSFVEQTVFQCNVISYFLFLATNKIKTDTLWFRFMESNRSMFCLIVCFMNIYRFTQKYLQALGGIPPLEDVRCKKYNLVSEIQSLRTIHCLRIYTSRIWN